MNLNYFYEYEALKLANNENDWMLHFKYIAQHFVKAFLKNVEKLKQWEQWTQENTNDSNVKNIESCLINYYNLFIALEPQENGDLNIHRDKLNKFQKIKDQEIISKLQEVSQSLQLYDYSVAGTHFTLNQLMNITLSFFHEEQVRITFFKNIISSPKDEVQRMTFNQMLPQNKVNFFRDFNC